MRTEIVYTRTALGRMVYDVVFSRHSAAEVARRHKKLTREEVLLLRKKYRKVRP